MSMLATVNALRTGCAGIEAMEPVWFVEIRTSFPKTSPPGE